MMLSSGDRRHLRSTLRDAHQYIARMRDPSTGSVAARAKSEGVEGTVTLYFIVRPDGSVRENIVVQKTAGFGDFDESARAALRAWRFQPLRDGRVGDQWGTITFQFRLSDHG